MKFRVGQKVKIIRDQPSKIPLDDTINYVTDDRKAGAVGIVVDCEILAVRIKTPDGNTGWARIEDVVSVHELSMKNAQFGITYDRDTDPTEFFSTRKAAEARIKELLRDDEVDKESIYLFQIAKQWHVESPVEYKLVEVK